MFALFCIIDILLTLLSLCQRCSNTLTMSYMLRDQIVQNPVKIQFIEVRIEQEFRV